jgi:hypothetical protein
MRNSWNRWFVMAFVIISCVSLADESVKDSPDYELGVAAGWPAIMGITLGYWGDKKLPFVARGTIGLGSSLDLGVCITCSNPDNRKVFIGGTAGMFGYFGVAPRLIITLGPTVGLKLGDFFVQAGPALHFVPNTPTNAWIAPSPGLEWGAQGQIGYSIAFDKF